MRYLPTFHACWCGDRKEKRVVLIILELPRFVVPDASRKFSPQRQGQFLGLMNPEIDPLGRSEILICSRGEAPPTRSSRSLFWVHRPSVLARRIGANCLPPRHLQKAQFLFASIAKQAILSCAALHAAQPFERTKSNSVALKGSVKHAGHCRLLPHGGCSPRCSQRRVRAPFPNI